MRSRQSSWSPSISRGLGRSTRRLAGLAIVLGLTTIHWPGTVDANGPRFYPDDPLWIDPDTELDASAVKPDGPTDAYDFLLATFGAPGDSSDVRALNVNTLDEVPDSSWFTNRIGIRPMTIAEIVRGPDRVESLEVEEWIVVEGKDEGRQLGFRATPASDPARRLYQIKFDPPDHPEMATGAEIIGTAIYHAIGFNVAENHLVSIDPDKVRIDPEATVEEPDGTERPLTEDDIAEVFRQAARRPDGRYRAVASRFVDGKPLGPFRYYGTRPDDPNDVFPHEHRRELRANRVFAAWLNHKDSRAINTLDMLVGPDGDKHVRHYLIDFGAVLGSGTYRPAGIRAGHGHLIEMETSIKSLVTAGVWTPPWMTRSDPEGPPAVGRLDTDAFDPIAWKPDYPNPAFDRMRPDDAFWGARIMAAFSDEAIRAIVAKARYGDPRAAAFLTRALIVRRDKIARAWLTPINPIVNVSLTRAGVLTFENAAVTAGVAEPATGYTLSWFHFDNATGRRQPVGTTTAAPSRRATAPRGALRGSEYIGVEILTHHPAFPHWCTPVRAYFRREGTDWTTVGLERLVPERNRSEETPSAQDQRHR